MAKILNILKNISVVCILLRALCLVPCSTHVNRIELRTQIQIQAPVTTWSLTERPTIHPGKGQIFNKWCWTNWITVCGRMKLNRYLSPAQNSPWGKSGSSAWELIPCIVRGKVGIIYQHREGILAGAAQELRLAIYQWDSWKQRQKTLITVLKRKPTELEKSLPAILLTEGQSEYIYVFKDLKKTRILIFLTESFSVDPNHLKYSTQNPALAFPVLGL